MDEEIMGQHIIFITIIGCILFLTYHAIPSNITSKDHSKVSKSNMVPQVADNKSSHNTAQNEVSALLSKEHLLETDQEDKLPVAEKSPEIGDSTQAVPVSQPVKLTGNSFGAAAVIPMNNSKYNSHKKGIVHFTHEKHVTDYAISCGDCHHDDQGTPLELTPSDSVQNCIECHPGTQKTKGEKLNKKQKITKYHFEAMHANCIGCHKPYNKEKGDPKGKGPAPTSCTDCHPKNKS